MTDAANTNDAGPLTIEVNDNPEGFVVSRSPFIVCELDVAEVGGLLTDGRRVSLEVTAADGRPLLINLPVAAALRARMLLREYVDGDDGWRADPWQAAQE
jgi:hypothetical protein